MEAMHSKKISLLVNDPMELPETAGIHNVIEVGNGYAEGFVREHPMKIIQCLC